MTPELLEQRLAQHPSSPLFARLASHYLELGNPHRGGELCRSGLERFPGYASAHVVLARCLAAQGDYQSALAELGTALEMTTEQGLLRSLQAEWAGLRDAQEHATAGEAVVEAGVHEEISPPQADVAVGESSPSADSRAEAAPEEPATAALAAGQETQTAAAGGRAIPEEEADNRIVSRTLAEIYARQGEFLEAIITYQLLKRQTPEQAGDIDRRIQELEIKLQEKLAG